MCLYVISRPNTFQDETMCINNLPEQNKYFSGRVDVLKNIDSLFNKENCNTTRNHLCAEIINEILFMINEIKNYNFINEYKARSIILNEKISFTKNGATNFGTAIDINDDGSLVVAKDNGETVILNTGEISIRRIANTY